MLLESTYMKSINVFYQNLDLNRLSEVTNILNKKTKE